MLLLGGLGLLVGRAGLIAYKRGALPLVDVLILDKPRDGALAEARFADGVRPASLPYALTSGKAPGTRVQARCNDDRTWPVAVCYDPREAFDPTWPLVVAALCLALALLLYFV